MGISPTTAQHVVRSLGERVDGILDGGRCNVGLESTVCAVVDGRVEILRPGGVTREMLREAGFELVEMQQAQGASDQSNETLRSPGQLSKHYAPGTPLVVLDGSATAVRDELESFRGSKIALLAERRTLDIIAASDRVEEFPLGEDSKTAEYARHLYGQLHAADASTADVIIAVVPPAEHMGEAIRDRLRRASSEWRTLE
jgi:L-threonylcarbamoyladenylate synthase